MNIKDIKDDIRYYHNDLLDIIIKNSDQTIRLRPWRFAAEGFVWHELHESKIDFRIPQVTYLSLEPIEIPFSSYMNRAPLRRVHERFYLDELLDLSNTYKERAVRSPIYRNIIGKTVQARTVYSRKKFLDELLRLQYKQSIGVKQ